MRAKFINEKFAEDSDPVKDIGIGKLAMFNNLEKRGIIMRFSWGDGEGEKAKQKVIENIVKVTKIIDKLEKIGFNTKDMFLSHSDSVSVSTYQILKSNYVLFDCPTEEDANIIIDVLKKFSIYEKDIFSVRKDRDIIYYNEPGFSEWSKNIISNRKKYLKFLNK